MDRLCWIPPARDRVQAVILHLWDGSHRCDVFPAVALQSAFHTATARLTHNENEMMSLSQ